MVWVRYPRRSQTRFAMKRPPAIARRLLPACLALLACGSRFGVASLDPPDGSVDEDVVLTVRGTGFTTDTAVRLESAQVSVDLLSPQLVDASTLKVAVPAGTPRGVYDVRVLNPDASV